MISMAMGLFRLITGVYAVVQLVEKAYYIYGEINREIISTDQLDGRHDQINHRVEQVYHSIQNWQELETIPDGISKDPLLNMFKCRKTNRCIRFIVGPTTDRTVYYERAEVEKLLSNQSSEPPPGWPSDLSFTVTNVKPRRSLQKVIDQRLEIIAKQWAETGNNHNLAIYLIK